MKVFELSKEFGITNKELIDFLKDSGYKISNHSQNVSDEMIEKSREHFGATEAEEVEKPVKAELSKTVPTPKKEPRQFNQNDLILCRSVTAGWLGVSGKSGQYYIFENAGDYCEIEYQDLFALKSRHSGFLYAPRFIIEDEELLENPRWKDLAKFYEDEVFTKEDVDEVLNLPNIEFMNVIKKLPKGLAKTLQVRVATKIEDGTFDSLTKIKAIDETFGTDFMSILSH